jgi:hypothetical protein
VIAPKISWNNIGNQIFCRTKLEHVDLEDLPPHVRHFVEKDTFAKIARDEIYFGIFSEALCTQDPKYDEISALVKKQDYRISMQEKFLKAQTRESQGYISDTLATVDRIRGQGIWARITSGGGNSNQPMEE